MLFPHDIGAAVQSDTFLVTAGPPVRIGRPFERGALRSLYAAVNQGEGAVGLAEIRLWRSAQQTEIAVDEDRPRRMRGIERFLPVEIEVAVQIYTIAGKGIVGTLHVAAVEKDASCPVERVHVQTTDEPHVAGHCLVAVAVGHMGLGDGTAALFAAQLWMEGIVQVYIAVVAHGEIAHFQSVAPEVEHGEIAVSTLGLTALRSQYHLLGPTGQSYQVKVSAPHRHTERSPSLYRCRHPFIVGVVNPIHIGCDVDRHGVGFGTVGKMVVYLLEGAVDKRMRLARRQSTVEKQMRPVERIAMALPNKKAVAHLYIVDSGIGCGAEARPYHKAMDKEKRSCQFSLQRHHTGKGTLCPDRPITCPDG